MKSSEIINICGYDNPRLINNGNSFEIWQVTYKHGFEEGVSNIVFFDSRATWESVELAGKYARQNRIMNINIIVQNSARISNDLKRIKGQFGSEKVKKVRDLLGDILVQSLENKKSEIESLKYFIVPNILDEKRNIKDNAQDIVLNWLNNEDVNVSKLAIIIGKPGVGKTTFGYYLYDLLNRNIKKDRRIPIIVTSEQWKKFAFNITLNLYDIWKEAMKYSNISDVRDGLFEIGTKCGAIFPIFDGFDELCSLYSHQFYPKDIIDALLRLTENEEGKILLTSRDVFWNENIPVEYKNKLEIFELQPFNKQQLGKYVEKRFSGNNKARQRAMNLITEYQDIAYKPMVKYPPSELRLGNVPVVVDLLCQCAEDPNNTSVNRNNDPINEILKMLCRRDMRRQEIETTEDIQLNIFKLIAINSKLPISEIDFSFYAQYCSNEFYDTSKLNRLYVHPLIEKQGENIYFKYEFLKDYLNALYATEIIFNENKIDDIVTIFKNYIGTSNAFYEYFDAIMCRVYGGQEEYIKSKKKIQRTINYLIKNKDWDNYLSGVMLQFIMKFINSNKESINKKELTTELMEYFSVGKFYRINFTGIIKNLDLRGILFEKCILSDVTYLNCIFDENTEFINCIIKGKIYFENSNGFKKMNKFKECVVDPISKDMLYGIVDAIGVDKNQVERWIYQFCKKFKNGIYFIPIGYEEIGRGIIFTKLNKDEFLKVFLDKNIIEKNSDAAGKKDELYSVTADTRKDVNGFLENGIIGGKIKIVYEEMVKKYCE